MSRKPKLSKIFAVLILSASLLSACMQTGVDPYQSKSQVPSFTFGNYSNPTTLGLGESITFSVYYQDTILKISGCKARKSDGSSFTGTEGGVTASTSTTCTYTAPSVMPSLNVSGEKAVSEYRLDVVATIADASPALEATLSIILKESASDACDASNSDPAYWSNWFSCDSPSAGDGSYSWWVTFAEDNGNTENEAVGILTCLSQLMCTTYPETPKGSCISSGFIETDGYVCAQAESTECNDNFNYNCLDIDDRTDCNNSYTRTDYGIGYRFYNCSWNDEMSQCTVKGSPEDQEGCTGGSASGPITSTEIAGNYAWDGETTSNEACDFNFPVDMYDPDDSQLTWSEDIIGFKFQFADDFITYGGQEYSQDTGVMTQLGSMTSKFQFSGQDVIFYFTGGLANGALCNVHPGKVYVKQFVGKK